MRERWWKSEPGKCVWLWQVEDKDWNSAVMVMEEVKVVRSDMTPGERWLAEEKVLTDNVEMGGMGVVRVELCEVGMMVRGRSRVSIESAVCRMSSATTRCFVPED